jgi:hypothetical protein
VASQVQEAAKKLEIAALGRPAQREDWIRDIGLRLGLIQADPSRSELIKLLAERFKFRSAYAKPALDTILIPLENRSDGFLLEVKKAREMLDRSSVVDFSANGFASEVFYSHLETEADEILAQIAEVQDEWADFQDFLESKNEIVIDIPKTLRNLCHEVGSDRISLARELKIAYLGLFNSQQECPPVVHLSYAWVCLQLGEPKDEILSLLASASRCLAPSVSSHLCCRLLSELYQRDGHHLRAAEWAKRAIEQRNCAEGNIEMALLASEMHEVSTAKPYMEEALIRRSASLLGLLADDRCIGLGTDFLDVLVRVQMRLRREGRQFILNWEAASKEIIEMQRTFEGDLLISHELLESHKTVPDRLADADLLSAGYLIQYCQESKDELRLAAQTSLEKDFERKREALTAARLGIDSVGTARENRLAQARLENDVRIKQTHQLIANLAVRSKLAEKQSVMWFGSGCGLFGFYMIAKVVMGMVGNSVDLPPAIGGVLIGIAALPIILSIGLQIHHGLTRAAAEIAIREKVSSANKAMSKGELEADEIHREQIANARKTLIDAESALRKVEAALKSMKFDTFEPENVSPRLKVA